MTLLYIGCTISNNQTRNIAALRLLRAVFHYRDRKEAVVVNILIIGCGRVGISLAERLDAHGHDVAIVDSDVDNFRAFKR